MRLHVECLCADDVAICPVRRWDNRTDALAWLLQLQPVAIIVEVSVVAVADTGSAKVTHVFGRHASQPGELVITRRGRAAGAVLVNGVNIVGMADATLAEWEANVGSYVPHYFRLRRRCLPELRDVIQKLRKIRGERRRQLHAARAELVTTIHRAPSGMAHTRRAP